MVLADTEDVEGDDASLSDESSFYGDDDLRSELEERAESFNPSHYWASHHLQLSVIANAAIEKEEMAIPVTKSQEIFNPYEDYPSGQHLSETIEAFMKRLPPLSTSIMEYGPWIYVANPYSPRSRAREDEAAFVHQGHQLLEDFTAIKAGIEMSMPGKAKSVIGRKLVPLRKQLELDIISLAKETNCTSGKWMLFPSASDVNTSWSLVAKGTVAGNLGHAAKVATDDGTQNSRLICIYTPDFSDKKDVKRVLEGLLAMGLCNRNGALAEGKAIYYKADAYTYLELNSGNEYGLKASMFSSREILAEGK